MKFLLFTFIILSINNTFGMSCDKNFQNPENTETKQGGAENRDVLQEDTNYGIYGTFPKGTPHKRITAIMQFTDAKLRRFGL